MPRQPFECLWIQCALLDARKMGAWSEYLEMLEKAMVHHYWKLVPPSERAWW